LFAGLGIYSHTKAVKTGLLDGRLQVCPGAPNCVCSEGDSANIAALKLTLTDQAGIIKQLEAMGGSLQEVKQDYLHATFTSRIFRFVDDLELRYDSLQSVWQVRSASRVGNNDMGVNRKRVEALRNQLSG